MKIYRLGNVPRHRQNEIGGKARGLDFLERNGFRIAEGYAVLDVEEVDPYEEDFYRIFDDIGAEEVSVRSSASDEDGENFSNAGQYETVLNVRRENLIDAVRSCVRSLHGERAENYAKEMTGSKAQRMNIVIEKMIKPAFSGVIFSKDPSDASRLLIEAVEGIGENLVSGHFSAQEYGISLEAFDYEAKEGDIVSVEQLKEMYEVCLKVRELFGNETDIEYAYDEKGLCLLQLRAITADEELDIGELNGKNDLDNHLLTSRNIGEMMPGAVTPLSISTTVLAIDYGLHYMFYEVGAVKKPSDIPDYSAALAIDGHLFLDMSFIHTLSLSVQIASAEAMNLSIMGESYPDYPPLTQKKKNIFTRIFNCIKFGKYLFSADKAKEKLSELEESLVMTQKDDLRSVYHEIEDNIDALNTALGYHYVTSSFSGSMSSALSMTLADKMEKTEYEALVASILENIDGIESADILASLRELARLVMTENPDAVGFNEKQLLEFINSSRHEEIKKSFDSFIAKHGHRSVKEADLRSKAWKNDLDSVMRNLLTVMKSPDLFEDKRSEPVDVEKILEEHGQKSSALVWIANNARKAVVGREYSKSKIIIVIDKFIDQFIILAKLMVEENLLGDEDSIYFLTHQEIGELIEGDISLKKKALQRRKVYHKQELIKFDDVCLGKPVPKDASDIRSVSELKGLSVCGGKVLGRARIVNSIEDADRIEKGEIMVAPFTDIGWSPYYSIISALITEVGSVLSHGAVVAREYALPTIVKASGACDCIHDGDFLYVDADSGIIDILSEEEYIRLQSETVAHVSEIR